ncbi:gamma-glutamyl-gamma-aminobutyrate hydrolase family protein, partial [Pseudomonas sp. Sample_9]
MAFKPLIGVTACVKQIGLHPYHISGDKYVRAVSVGAEGLPVVIPSLGNLTEIDDLLGQLDGLLLTGSPSNVEPFHYQGPASAPGTDHDPARDATTLPLLRAAIAAGVPVLGICRGFQEMNVAFGGSLHQKVHE